jgi:Flp pilus assembly protein TadD
MAPPRRITVDYHAEVTVARASTAIFVAALACRVLAVVQLGPLPISRTPQLDSMEYLLWARQIAEGRWTWPAYPEHAPGYPFFLGALLAVTGQSLTAVRIAQATLGSLSCVLTARIAGRTLTPRAFLPAGLLQALYAPFIYLDTALLAEPLLVLLMLMALDLATRAGTHRATWMWSGVALGGAAVVRPTALVLLPAFSIAVWWQARRGDQPALGRAVAPLLIGVLLVISPVVIQNWRVSGIPLIQAYGGMNLYLGNTPQSDGAARARPGGWWDALEADASRAATSRDGEDRYFLQRTFSEISRDPLGYLRLLVNKAAWMTQDEELRDSHSLYFFQAAMPLLLGLPGFGIVFALALAGAFGLRDARAAVWVLLPLAALATTVIFLVVGSRYRAPMVPLIMALAGAGVIVIVQRVQSRNWPGVAAAGAVAVVAFLASDYRRDEPSRNLAEEWAFTGLALREEGQLAAAESALRRAISLDERSSFAWDGLGLVLQRRGDATAARAAFERAAALNDAHAAAWHHVGLMHDQRAAHEEALRAYRRALAVAPERTEFNLSYGLTLHRLGRLSEADPHLRKAAERGEGRAHVALAISALKLQNFEQARRHAREAVRLMPEYPLARNVLSAAERAPR